MVFQGTSKFNFKLRAGFNFIFIIIRIITIFCIHCCTIILKVYFFLDFPMRNVILIVELLDVQLHNNKT